MRIRGLLSVGFGIFLLLFMLTLFVPSQAAQSQALPYFSTDEINSGLQFAFERRLFFWFATALELGLLVYLVGTGAARRWADRLQALVGGSWIGAVLLMGASYWLLHQALQLPIAVARFYHTRSWGLSQRDVEGWLAEYALYQGLTCLLEGCVLVGLYLLLRRFPKSWWLPATGGATLVAIGVAWLWPVFISPLFNTFTPLAETKWADLEPRVRRLVDAAGVPVQEILVMDASRQGNHSNAYFAGFGSSRRIVLFDTLLDKHEPDEAESILAHEIGHWRHDHIVKGILIGTLGALGGLFVLSRLLLWAIGKEPLGLRSPSDPAGLPLILLLINLGAWLSMPAENAVSRYFERQADEASLELAGRPEAFIEAEKRLARQNIGNVAPPPWNVWLFSTHPTTVERIKMAEDWRK